MPPPPSVPITSFADFDAIRNNTTGHFHLTADIDLLDTGFQTIPEFNGHLDGRGFSISNFLYLGDELDAPISSKKSAAGLIRKAINANIRNIRMVNCQITSGNSRVGCLVGNAVSTTFHRVGVLQGSQVTCTGDAKLNAAWACGGLVGGLSISAALSECFSQAAVDGGLVYLTGGLVGGQPGGKDTTADFVIENSYSSGRVSGRRYVGGLTGGTTGGSTSKFILRTSFSYADVKGQGQPSFIGIGGLIGKGTCIETKAFYRNTVEKDTCGKHLDAQSFSELGNFRDYNESVWDLATMTIHPKLVFESEKPRETDTIVIDGASTTVMSSGEYIDS